MLSKIRKYLYLIRTDLLGFYHNLVEKIELPEEKAGEDIFYLKIGDGGHKIIFVSAIHGNELGTVKLANRLIEYLDANKNKFQEFTFFIVPCLNYDGCRLAMSHLDYLHGGRIGRFNNNKVDLNRNFPTKSWKNISKWSFGKNYEEKKDVNCGSSPGSEKEVNALCDLIKREGISVFFSFHNVGRDVMPNDLDLAVDLADIYRQKTGFCLQTYDDWKKLSQTGTAREWCNENNISYLEIECPYRWGSDWLRQKEAILSCLAFFQNKNND
jgi:predicted deacylase